jgi:hypothetical protein
VPANRATCSRRANASLTRDSSSKLRSCGAAELLDAPDVVATCAIHAAIAAADAITGHALGERSSDDNRVSAVDLLRQVDTSLATALKRALDRKTQAGYGSVDVSSTDATGCIRWARQLLAEAEARFEV